MKKIISLIVILFMVCACSKGYETITRNRAEELLASGALLVDVRTEDEYNEGHILDAINIPLDQIRETEMDRDTILIVYCATGVRSLEAAKELVKIGYNNVYNLDGGILNWGDE